MLNLLRQVEGIGPYDASIMLVGEALGTDERLRGEPFIGWSGQFLREMCERAGLDWSQLRVDNVVQYQPDRNDFSVFYTNIPPRGSIGIPTLELLAWHKDLKERIRQTKPKVIIAAGDHPLFALTGNKSSTLWRGSVVPYQDRDFTCHIIPIVHPSYSRRCYNMTSAKQKDVRQPWFHISVFDLKKAKRISDKGWKPIERIEKTFPTYLETMEYLEELYAMPSDTLIITDVETIRREHIKCVGITHRKDMGFCIPFVANGAGKPFYSLTEEYEVWRMIDKVFSTHRLGNQTIDFDLAQFYRDVGMEITDNVYLDTAVLHSVLYPELKHDLGFLTSLYTDMPYFKYLGKQSEGKSNVSQTFTYNCYDLQSTMEIAEALIVEAKTEGMWEYYLNKRLPLLKWAIRQHQHGLRVDETRRKPIGQALWQEEIKPKQVALNEALAESNYPMQNTKPNKTLLEKFEIFNINEDPGIDVVNVRSPKQVIDLLRQLGYTIASSDEDTLKNLPESVVAKTIMELRSDYSLLGSLSKPEDEDARFRTTLKLYVTETTRLSSTKSHYNTGANMQNVTPRARPLFCGSWEKEENVY